jgi:hypothetical protein
LKQDKAQKMWFYNDYFRSYSQKEGEAMKRAVVKGSLQGLYAV